MKALWSWLAAVALLGCTSPQAGGRRGLSNVNQPDRGTAATCGGVVCDPNAACSGSGVDASCACRSGFSGDGTTCEDIDECAEPASNDCDAHAACINAPGGFRCQCQAGFLGDGKTCARVDECDGETNACDPNALCINDDSGFTCQCSAGYAGNGNGCGDIDECADGSLFDCAANASCANTFGGFSCECDLGYSGDGNSACRGLCELAKAEPSVCAAQGLCRVGGRAALCDACNPGFSGDGKSCAAAACDAQCDGAGSDDTPNTICVAGGACACAPGYAGTPGNCRDVDECAAADACGDNALCRNVDGGFLCGCQPGYALGAAGSCEDVDECASTPGPCHPDAVCTNQVPGFVCECRAGFTGDGSVCEDVDECREDNGGCDANATCVNQRGSSSCECRAPLTGHPEDCYCDLSGVWAMRHDLDACWASRQVLEATQQDLISAGYMEAYAWELHELSYDGKKLSIRSKPCGADNTPDLVSPLFRETYSEYVPLEGYDTVELAAGEPFEQRGIVPGSRFSTPSVAAVIGIDLGDDPLSAPWPASYDAVADKQWLDTDGDGEPGMTLWPRLPSERTDSGTRNYSYLPARPGVRGSNVFIEERAGCLSIAARVISHLEVTVDSCTRLTGKVVNERTEGRVHSCTLVDKKPPCNPDNPNDCPGWHEDVACTPERWQTAERCTAEDLARLDDDQNQKQDSNATFEFVKIGEVGESRSCSDVREALPAVKRPVPTITCAPPK